MRLVQLGIAFVLAATLAGCGTFQKGSVTGSESGALKGPEFAVRGATPYDQNWIDETEEAGVSALGWSRPKPRPPEMDKPQIAAVLTAHDASAAPVKSTKKLSLWKRVKSKFKKPAPVS